MKSWQFVSLKTYASSPQSQPEEASECDSAACRLDDALSIFGSVAPHAGFPQVIAGLFGNADRLLRTWASERDAQIFEAPPAQALLDGTATLWPELLNAGETIFVIPALEQCFLRHWRGIRLVRSLVETVWAQPCRLVIGCDVWAWKYLQQAVQIDSLCPDALTAAPLMTYPVASDTTPNIAPRAKESRLQAYVLHTLLMHDGMSASVLPQLLPFRTTEILKTLADLREQQLAFEEDGRWRVARKHYAAIRSQLAAVEFWVG